MKRSSFLKTIGTLTAGAVLPVSFLAAPEPEPSLAQIDNKATYASLDEAEMKKAIDKMMQNLRREREAALWFGSPDLVDTLGGIS